MPARSPARVPTTADETPLGVRLYRVARMTNRAYAYAVLWGYISAFVLAFGLMFIFPPGTLLLVFLGVFGLVAAVGGGQLLGAIEHAMARRLLRHGRCPQCGRTGIVSVPERSSCGACRAAFDGWGGEIDVDQPVALGGGLRRHALSSGLIAATIVDAAHCPAHLKPD